MGFAEWRSSLTPIIGRMIRTNPTTPERLGLAPLRSSIGGAEFPSHTSQVPDPSSPLPSFRDPRAGAPGTAPLRWDQITVVRCCAAGRARFNFHYFETLPRGEPPRRHPSCTAATARGAGFESGRCCSPTKQFVPWI